MKLIFDNTNTKKNLAQPQHFASDRQKGIGMTDTHSCLVKLMSTFLFAQANRSHFEQPTFNWPMEISVWLDPIHQHDSIGTGSIAILIQYKRTYVSKLDNLH